MSMRIMTKIIKIMIKIVIETVKFLKIRGKLRSELVIIFVVCEIVILVMVVISHLSL